MIYEISFFESSDYYLIMAIIGWGIVAFMVSATIFLTVQLKKRKKSEKKESEVLTKINSNETMYSMKQ